MAIIQQLGSYLKSDGTRAQINNNIIFESGGETQLGTAGSGIACVIVENTPWLPQNIPYLVMSVGKGDYDGILDMQTLIDDNIA